MKGVTTRSRNRCRRSISPRSESSAVITGLFAAWDAAAAQDRASRDAFVSGRLAKTAPPPFSFVLRRQGFVRPHRHMERDLGGEDGRSRSSSGRSSIPTRRRGSASRRSIRSTRISRRRNGSSASRTPVARIRRSSRRSRPAPSRFPAFAASASGPVMLYRARGSNAERSDFGPINEPVAPKAEVRFGPTAGRSSDTNALPFFNIATPEHGVVAAIGWSGRWEAVVGRKGADPRSLDLTAGMAATHFKLHPGEEVRTPSDGPPLLEERRPDVRSQPFPPLRPGPSHAADRTASPRRCPITHGVGFGGPFPCNEYVCATESYAIGMIERLHQFGIEPDACWIDAGWYENPTGQWWSGVGTWTVNKKNFPRGLKPVTEAAKKYGPGLRRLVRARARLRRDVARPRAQGLADHPPRQPQPPARPGQPEGAGLAHRPHRELHPGRGRDRSTGRISTSTRRLTGRPWTRRTASASPR